MMESIARSKVSSNEIVRKLGTSSLLLLTLSLAGFSRDGTWDPSFRPVLSQVRDSRGVTRIRFLPSGQILAAGGFTVADGVIRQNFAKLNSDGSIDTSFEITVSSTDSFVSPIINEFLVQPDGKMIIAGAFNTVNSVPANRVARLNSDGTTDTTFAIGSGFDDIVTALALQSDGKVLVGGNFSSFNGTNKSLIARLNSDGSLDTSFIASFSTFEINSMRQILPTVEGKILVQGRFNRVNGEVRPWFVRLNSDGTTDNTFQTPNYTSFNSIGAAALQPDGKILIGGSFEIRISNQVVNQNFARLNSDGTHDPSLSTTMDGSVAGISGTADEKIYLTGGFQTVNGSPRGGIARLTNDGALDATFNASFTAVGEIRGFSQNADGIFVNGSIRSVNGTPVEGLAKLDDSGNLDSSFPAHFAILSSLCTTSALQPDGKLLIAGDFNRVNGQVHTRMARVLSDGAIDDTFHAEISNGFPGTTGFEDVNEIGLQTDGKILIGGSFAEVNGETHRYLARIEANGAVDGSFNPILTHSGGGGEDISAIAIASDGRIVIGGNFQTINGIQRWGYGRLNAPGELDTGFVIPFDDSYGRTVEAIQIRSNGKILIGGEFRFVGDAVSRSIAQLNSDGSIDDSFTVPSDPAMTPYLVGSLALQPDNKVLVGGKWSGGNRPLLVRLNTDGTRDTSFSPGQIGIGFFWDSVESIFVTQNQKIVIAGGFSSLNGTSRRNIARLIDNGSIDFSFSTPQFRGTGGVVPAPIISALHQDHDGKVLITGLFIAIDGNDLSGVARLNSSFRGHPPVYDFDGDTRSDLGVYRPSTGAWYLEQSTAGFSALSFGNTADRITPADFDGDGKTDVAVYRPESGTWYWLNSSNGAFNAVQFGATEDLPTPAHYDGDGRADVSVFRPSNGTWYRLNSSTGEFFAVQFGVSEDKPTIGDYDGDGRADIAVWRPSNGAWYRLNSSNGAFVAVSFGLSDDLITPADFDGDGATDVAVYRPSTATWYSLNSSNGALVATQFGSAEDEPTAADYNGDGRADISVFRPSNGVWYRLNSGNGSFFAAQFGVTGDRPTPAAFRF
jgi:uncharacterized delta-60 repeat protein